MAMYDDDNFGGIFPRRTGVPTGAANERKMLDAIGGSEGIRTQQKTNLDGSITMLRTRDGMPEFSRMALEGGTSAAFNCAAIPVCTAAPFGFKYVDVATLTAFNENAEPNPASAYLRKADLSPVWNKLWTQSLVKLPQHPGNRIWYDCRDEGFREFTKVVSWWCPINDLLPSFRFVSPYQSGEEAWLGGLGSYSTSYTLDAQVTAPLSGDRGDIFINGKKVYSFSGTYVLAAAVKMLGQEMILHAVTTDAMQVEYGRLDDGETPGIAFGNMLLQTVNLTTLVTSSETLDAGVPSMRTTTVSIGMVINMPQFSPDVSELTYAKLIPYELGVTNETIHLVTRILSTQAETVLWDTFYDTPVSGVPGPAIAVWYTKDGVLNAIRQIFVRTSTPTGLFTNAYTDEGKMVYGPWNAPTEDLGTLFSVNLGFAGTPEYRWYGDVSLPLAHDGFGSFLIARGPIDAQTNVALALLGGAYNSYPTTLFEMPYVRYLAGFAGHPAPEMELRVYARIADNNGAHIEIEVPDARIPFCVHDPYSLLGLPIAYRVTEYLDVVHSSDFSYPYTVLTQSAGIIGISFAVSPERTSFVAGTSITARTYWNYYHRLQWVFPPGEWQDANPGVPPDLIMQDNIGCITGVMDNGSFNTFNVANFWTGEQSLLNSPVFFSRMA